ncbi:hypothetical protein HDU93_007474 [Gonapodya sp. JEL0774]|nr:hypothetical protein HDU93_007474 [Gonapodya sp. JEL0774]
MDTLAADAASGTQVPSLSALEDLKSTSPTWFASNYIVFLFIIYITMRLCGFGLKRLDPVRWKTFTEEQRVNVISYAVQFAGIRALSPSYQVSLLEMQLGRAAGSVVCLLYAAELLFRRKLRLTLVTHHISTIGICIFFMAMFERTFDPTLVRMALAFLYQATLEQLTFAGLLLYRFSPKTWVTYYTLLVGAVLPLALKLLSLGYVMVMWGKYIIPQGTSNKLYLAFDIVLPVVASILLFTQVWSANVVWKLALRSRPDGASSLRKVEAGSFEKPLAPSRNGEDNLLIPDTQKPNSFDSRYPESVADRDDIGDIMPQDFMKQF